MLFILIIRMDDYSVIRSCIRRFREQAPMPKEIRKLPHKNDFWWLNNPQDYYESNVPRHHNINEAVDIEDFDYNSENFDKGSEDFAAERFDDFSPMESSSSVSLKNELINSRATADENEEFLKNITSNDPDDLDARADALLRKCELLIQSYDKDKASRQSNNTSHQNEPISRPLDETIDPMTPNFNILLKHTQATSSMQNNNQYLIQEDINNVRRIPNDVISPRSFHDNSPKHQTNIASVHHYIDSSELHGYEPPSISTQTDIEVEVKSRRENAVQVENKFNPNVSILNSDLSSTSNNSSLLHPCDDGEIQINVSSPDVSSLQPDTAIEKSTLPTVESKPLEERSHDSVSFKDTVGIQQNELHESYQDNIGPKTDDSHSVFSFCISPASSINSVDAFALGGFPVPPQSTIIGSDSVTDSNNNTDNNNKNEIKIISSYTANESLSNRTLEGNYYLNNVNFSNPVIPQGTNSTFIPYILY